MYKSVFSPFPEGNASMLLTDARKLVESGFVPPYGLLGIYYEKIQNPFGEMTADRLAEKLALDVGYWFDIDVEPVAVRPLDGLRHPHHQQGATIAWLIE